jgi:PAS domain S-box-containing protein
MGDAVDNRQRKLEAAQQALAEAEARYALKDAECRAVTRELQNVRRSIEFAHRDWMSDLDVVDDLIFVHDKDFRVIRCNRAYQRAAGIPFKQIIGQLYYEIFPKADTPLHQCLLELEKPLAEGNEEELTVGDIIYRSRAYWIKDAQGGYLHAVHTLEDVTARVRAEQMLQQSELQYRRLFEAAKDGILILDAETGKIVDANPFILTLLSYSLSECIGKELWEIGLFGDIDASQLAFHELQNKQYIRYEDLPLQARGGRRIDVEFVSNTYPVGDRKVIQCNIRDITARKRAEDMLVASYDLLQYVVESVPMRIFWKDAGGRYLGCNTLFARDAGMSGPEELLGKDDFQMDWAEQAELYRADDRHVMDAGIPKLGYEEPQTTPDGRHIWLRTSKVPLRDADGGILGILGIYEDITEHKQAEDALRRANRALKTLSAGNLALVRATTEGELLETVTNVIVKNADYRLAAVCYAEEDAAKSISLVAWSGAEDNSFWLERSSWADTEQEQSPVAMAIRSGTTQILRDIASAPGFSHWKDLALAHGYGANISLPLSVDGRTFGSLCVYSSEPDAFDNEDVRLLEELASDLAYGITTLRARVAQAQHARVLRRSLEQSIQTIAATVEARDPYTAGHQRRVGELATAIALEIGLSPEQVDGIHFAAIVHDLGKIHVPAEILAKPGKLSELEYMLIKTHPQAGYDIPKDVEFPWPIADIVVQHHERLDGTGYPYGLKDGQILIESKIMAVADVVEAIYSHRPYRAALGIDAALDAIKLGRGSSFESSVVDACVRIFVEKGFVFSTRDS